MKSSGVSNFAEGVAVKQFIAIVNDGENIVKTGLFGIINHDLAMRTLLIENDYYKADVGVQSFKLVRNVAEACAHDKLIPALIVRYESLDQLKEAEKELSKIDADAQVIVCPQNIEGDAEVVEKWARENKFEVVYLSPTKEQLEEYKEHNETYGFQRLLDVLNSCMWPVRKDKIKKVSSNIQLDRILKLINNMEDEDDSDGIPDEEAQEAIWNSVTIPRSWTPTPEPQRAERVHLSSSPTEGEQPVSTVSVDVCLGAIRQPEQIDAKINESVNASVNKKRRKKEKKSKGTAKLSPDASKDETN
ncbi:unnamed protein product [Caenorhabditis auriculariae]|uniref:Uncharacterized protein n=1 Tax=Caenorhabditis auriculariae TaxID=2777116 RepID=A0A8S1GPD9_9PELO|nr:unnamed protein product [Caenorhabditis auriculariae]